MALAVLELPAGQLADAYGRRRTFVAGLVVFTVASLLAGVATSGSMLIAARALHALVRRLRDRRHSRSSQCR